MVYLVSWILMTLAINDARISVSYNRPVIEYFNFL